MFGGECSTNEVVQLTVVMHCHGAGETRVRATRRRRSEHASMRAALRCSRSALAIAQRGLMNRLSERRTSRKFTDDVARAAGQQLDVDATHNDAWICLAKRFTHVSQPIPCVSKIIMVAAGGMHTLIRACHGARRPRQNCPRFRCFRRCCWLGSTSAAERLKRPQCATRDECSTFGPHADGKPNVSGELCTKGQRLAAYKGAFPCAGTF